MDDLTAIVYGSTAFPLDSMTQTGDGWGANDIAYMWKRAKGYFDVVSYTGTGSARTIAHSLGVVPEMIWLKNLDQANNWSGYSAVTGNTHVLPIDEAYQAYDQANWNDTTPTSSVFSVGTPTSVNGSSRTYIAYLFASLAGISKVGEIAHSGSSTDVDCGFSNGARFVLLKRHDAAEHWYVWDSVRGIIAGNDPYILLGTNAAQVTNTDYIDPLASGFQISGDFTDGNYIFYAIA